MAFRKISEMANHDINSIDDNDLLTVVDTSTGQNRKMLVGTFYDWVERELGHLYTSQDFDDQLLASGIVARLDSEHGWNVYHHGVLETKIDNEKDARIAGDSDLNARVDAELVARSNADSDLNARLDSEHAWNLTEHGTLLASVDSEHAWNVTEHGILSNRLDSEHSYLLSELNKIDSELGVLTNDLLSSIDSDITIIKSNLDSEHAWNVAEHNALQNNINELDSNVTASLDSLSHSISNDIALQIDQIQEDLDSEHAWNVSEHSSLSARLDSEHAWNLSEHTVYSLAVTLRTGTTQLPLTPDGLKLVVMTRGGAIELPLVAAA